MKWRHASLAAQAVVTVILLTLLLRGFDWTAFGALFRQTSPVFYAGSLLAAIAGQFAYAFRWRLILAGIGTEVPYREVLRQHMLGLFFGNLLPTAVGGDVAKVYYLGRHAGYVQVGVSVVLDRLMGWFWLATIGAAVAWSLPADSAMIVSMRSLMALTATTLAAVAVATRLPIEGLLNRFAPRGAVGWVPNLTGVIVSIRTVAGRPLIILGSAAVVLGYAGLLALVYQRYFASHGVAVDVAPVLLVIVGLAILVNVPISLNGIGLREQLHFVLFAAVGVPKELAVSIGLLMFAHTLIMSGAGGVLWYRNGKK